jgi:HEPN domain-containing protein
MLQLARHDLAVLEALHAAPTEVSTAFGFHVQQAIEKTLKAWLSFLGVTYPRTHGLAVLFDLLEDQGAQEICRFRDLDEWSPFAVQYRYQDLVESLDLDRPAAIRQAAELIAHVASLLDG